jgi:TonB family protein
VISLLLAATLKMSAPAPLTCAELTPPEIAGLAGKDTKVTLDLEKTSLDRVFKALGEQAGFKPSFRGHTPIVTVGYRDLPLAEVLDDLASRFGLAIRSTGPDRLEVRGGATANLGGVGVPEGKERTPPAPVPGLGGKVVLYVLVCEDGTVRAVSEAPGTDEPRLVQPAIDAVRRWTYVPAEKDGKPVAVSLTVVVVFRPE